MFRGILTNKLFHTALASGTLLWVTSVSGQEVHPAGTPYATVIGFGDEYTSSIELYDVTITVEQAARGGDALQLLSSHGAQRPAPPPTGAVYVVVRVLFGYAARGAPGDKPYPIREQQFTAVTGDGQEYVPETNVSMTPRLNGLLKAPATIDGWLVFIVDSAAGEINLVFREEVGNTIHRGDGLWFRLFP